MPLTNEQLDEIAAKELHKVPAGVVFNSQAGRFETQHQSDENAYLRARLESAERERDALWETFVNLGELLGLDPEIEKGATELPSGVFARHVEKIAGERDAAQADAAAMREAAQYMLDAYRGIFASGSWNSKDRIAVGKMRVALSTSAGTAMLAELHGLRERIARVEGLKRYAQTLDDGEYLLRDDVLATLKGGENG